MSRYVLDPSWIHERERLDIQASLNDPATRTRIEGLGIRQGWCCAEVGAGTGTMASWLCERVGPSGTVLATDTDTRFLDALSLPNLTVQQHDIVAEELESSRFDLVYARLVLAHLGADIKAGLEHMVRALKPGGWLLVEELYGGTLETVPPREVASRLREAIAQVGRRLGVNQQIGRQLPALLEEMELANVEADLRSKLLKQGFRRDQGRIAFSHV